MPDSSGEPAAASVPDQPPSDAQTPSEPSRPGRWPLGVAAAMVVGLPIGWLLSFAALLPCYIGLFFFVLFGLLLGAVAYRIGSPARPVSKAKVVAGTTLIVLMPWAVSIVVEAATFPKQVAKYALEKTRKLPEGVTAQDFPQESADGVVQYLREHHPPGGLTGYIHWALTDSQIKPPVAHLPVTFRSSQPRHWWAIRVVLSLGLLGLGIHSQVGALRHRASRKDRRGSSVNPLSKI